MSMPDCLRNTIEGIRSLVNFFPVIWRFRSWDWSHNLAVVKRSLELTEETTRLHSYHECAEREAKNMRVAIHLMGRIMKDDYCAKEREDLDREFGQRNPLAGIHMFDHKEHKERMRIFLKSEALAKADWHYLFQHLKKHMKHWWS